MKMFVLKKKSVFFLIVFLIVGCAIGTCFKYVSTMTKPSLAKTIVIDAGHGGVDGGATGRQTKIEESELNLEYAKTLKKIFVEFGFNVVMTREDMRGLYQENAKIKKKSEMEKRKEIIERANADAVISLHMNSFSDSSVRGAHVFYDSDNDAGKVLAGNVAKVLNENIEHAYKTAKAGDYFVLKCTNAPSVLVECGFLSNPEEEKLLQNKDYIQKFCYNIFCGVYLSFK